MIPVFVYGSLREGLYNYDRILKGKVTDIDQATIEGFDMLDMGSYPGIINGKGLIVGEVMNINPAMYLQTLKILDSLEGYDPRQKGKSLYLREIKKVKLADGKEIDAYVYIYNIKRGIDYPVVESGDWVSFGQKKAGLK